MSSKMTLHLRYNKIDIIFELKGKDKSIFNNRY